MRQQKILYKDGNRVYFRKQFFCKYGGGKHIREDLAEPGPTHGVANNINS